MFVLIVLVTAIERGRPLGPRTRSFQRGGAGRRHLHAVVTVCVTCDTASSCVCGEETKVTKQEVLRLFVPNSREWTEIWFLKIRSLTQEKVEKRKRQTAGYQKYLGLKWGTP
jgi:hypothetical protein